MNTYTIQKAKQEIKSSIAVYLKKDANGEYRMKEVNRLPFYLQGPPGIGKTEAARQIAEELNIGFVSLSITHHTRNTVLGLPVIQTISEGQNTKYTEYTMSEMIAMVEKKVEEGYREGILLVDEFSCMAESLVAPMLAFLQTKNIGNHRLPEGWVLILCSNPAEYNKSARSFDMAVMDRVRLMEVVASPEEFIRYGRENGLHEDILRYLEMFPKDAYRCESMESGEKIIVTTRGWENLSWCLKGYEEEGTIVTQELIEQFIKSGEIARRFLQYYLSMENGISMEELKDLLEGRNLSRIIDRMKHQKYKTQFNVMRMLGEVLVKEGESIEKEKDVYLFIHQVKDALEGFSDYYEMIEERILGGNFAFLENQRELDETERELWDEIRTNYRKNGWAAVEKKTGDKVHDIAFRIREFEEQLDSEELRQIFCETVEECLQREENKKLRPKYEELSEKITNAFGFLEEIEDKNNLTGLLVNLLNQNAGVLDAMAAIRNDAYLKYCKRAYGRDGSLERIAEKLTGQD